MVNLTYFNEKGFLGLVAWAKFIWHGQTVDVNVTKDQVTFSCSLGEYYPAVDDYGEKVTISKEHAFPIPHVSQTLLTSFIDAMLPEWEILFKHEMTRRVGELFDCANRMKSLLLEIEGKNQGGSDE